MKFLCDTMVQKVGRLLILLGFDTEIIKKPEKLTNIVSKANSENRLIITRNTKIKEYPAKFILLKEQKPYDQLLKIVKELNLKIDIERIFTRCSLCNTPLQAIEKQKITDKIPPLTLQNTNQFYICSVCNKIYWKATHFDMFKEKIKKLYQSDNKN